MTFVGVATHPSPLSARARPLTLRKDSRDSLGLSLNLSIRGLIYCMATAVSEAENQAGDLADYVRDRV